MRTLVQYPIIMRYVFLALAALFALPLHSQYHVESVLTEEYLIGEYKNLRLETYSYEIYDSFLRRKVRRYHNDWDPIGQRWEGTHRYDFTYIDDDIIYSERKQTLLSSNLTETKIHQYTTSFQDSVITTYKTNAELEDSRELFFYDSDGHLDSSITQQWNADSADWFDWARYEYETDEDGNIMDQILSLKNQSSGVWNPLSRFTSTSYAPDEIDTTTIYTWSSSNWNPVNRSFTYRNLNGHVFKTSSETYVSGIWLPAARENHIIYPNGLTDHIIYQVWNSSSDAYEIVQRVTFEYLAPLNVEEPTNASFSIYPNPSNGIITVASDQSTPRSIHVISSQGQIVHVDRIVSPMKEIDLNHLAAGSYFILISGERSTSIPLVIHP